MLLSNKIFLSKGFEAAEFELRSFLANVNVLILFELLLPQDGPLFPFPYNKRYFLAESCFLNIRRGRRFRICHYC